MTRSSSSVNNTQTNSSSTSSKIYEAVNSNTNTNSSPDRATPIYETDWTHNLKRLLMNKKPFIKRRSMSVIEIPTSSSSSSIASSSSPTPPDLVPSTHYFQQQQHPYAKFLENRKRTSDSMRRANMLKRLKDDAAFLY